MCTMITTKHQFEARAKGPDGWFEVKQVYLGYDHPAHSPSDHAVLFDLANEEIGTGARLGVELTTEAATRLAYLLLETVQQAARYEAKSARK